MLLSPSECLEIRIYEVTGTSSLLTHLDCVIPGNQVQTHLVDDLVLQVEEGERKTKWLK